MSSSPRIRARLTLLVMVLLVMVVPPMVPGCSRDGEGQSAADTAQGIITGGNDPRGDGQRTGEDEDKRPGNLFDARRVKVGDHVLGLEIIQLAVNELDSERYSARVQFSGEVTVNGTYTHHPDYEEILGGRISFEVDEDSAGKLPKVDIDNRIAWFVFKNHDEAEGQLGPPGTSGTATVVIDNYGINHTYSDEWNTASLVKVVQKRSFMRSEDIDDIDVSRLFPMVRTLDQLFTFHESLFRIGQIREALRSFIELTKRSKERFTKEELTEIKNTDWDTQFLGFHNWVSTVEGTLRRQDYRIKKLELELARKRYESGEIARRELEWKEKAHEDSKREFQRFMDSFTIAD